MKYKLISLIILLCIMPGICLYGQHSRKASRPTLVVNIVVSGMRHDALDRYRENLSENGFRQFLDKGVVFTEARYDFMQTNTPATLATLVTGTNPCVHGVIGDRWQDFISSETVNLIDDPGAQGLNSDMGIGAYSPVNLTVPSLGDGLRHGNPRSKSITVAADPVSAVAMGGINSEAYWLDTRACNWTSSSKYMLYLPGWAVSYNEQNNSRKYSFLNYQWATSKSEINYVNSRFCILNIPESVRFRKIPRLVDTRQNKTAYANVMYNPLSNELVGEFVRQVVVYEDLGKDSNVDILNICFDAPANVAKLYGPESIEAEDMFYRLDRTIASIVEFIRIQVGEEKVLFVLTSDHGSSDSYDITLSPRPRFNGDQFRMIINTFLGAQFGHDNLVSAYYDRRLYLNRNNVYASGLSLEEVQKRAAAFALQFRGISHVLTSTAMQESTYSDNYLRKVQNGFYPKRSGDLAVNLMAGWIEEREGTRSAAGSLYDYDTHVPLMFLGCGLTNKVIDTDVDMAALAPTLARIMRTDRPAACTSQPITEITEMFR